MKGKVFQHYKTKAHYIFIDEGKLESTLENVAIYQRVATGQFWVRPMSEFLGKVSTNDGTIVSRFEEVKDEDLH
jgi:hypothetical protein